MAILTLAVINYNENEVISLNADLRRMYITAACNRKEGELSFTAA